MKDLPWAKMGPLIDLYWVDLKRYPEGHWRAFGYPKLGGRLNGVGDTARAAIQDLFVTAKMAGLDLKSCDDQDKRPKEADK